MRPQIPVAPPPGIDAGMYQQALAYLKANPEVAMQTQEQVGSPQCRSTARRRLAPASYPAMPCQVVKMTETFGKPRMYMCRCGEWATRCWRRQQAHTFKTLSTGAGPSDIFGTMMQTASMSARRSLHGTGCSL